jgi:hypothetical protein
VDLRLYFGVLWRFKVVMAIGLLIALALAFLSFARVSFAGGSPHVSYRQSESYQASVMILVTQKGFPYGYTVAPFTQAKLPDGSPTFVPTYADTGRFTQLAVYYAPLVRSDEFIHMLRQTTRIPGVVDAQTVLDPAHKLPLPYIQLFGYATSSANAIALANAGSETFSRYLLSQQEANNIPPSKRVEPAVISRASQAVLSSGRKTTTPIVIFLTVMLAAVGTSFVLENLRPRVRSVKTLDEAERAPAARHSA